VQKTIKWRASAGEPRQLSSNENRAVKPVRFSFGRRNQSFLPKPLPGYEFLNKNLKTPAQKINRAVSKMRFCTSSQPFGWDEVQK